MTSTAHESDMDIFGPDDVERYRDEWRSVQAGFVDDPEAAVREADRLVERVMAAMSSRLTESRDRSTDGDDEGRRTEQLRLILRRYRTVFQQLTGVPSKAGTERSIAVRPTSDIERQGESVGPNAGPLDV